MAFLVQIIVNTAAFFISVKLLAGINFQGPWWHLVIAGLIFGILNYILYLYLKALWPQYIFFTLALFTIMGNLFFSLTTAFILNGLSISGFWSAFWILVILSLTNYATSAIMHYE
ncbi:MAG: hypothetical protein GF332_03440 [Candidatus Moranbacteria bacterium]|nr:hypothetical protein [Candidatus Moranbacteria bacterium]